MLSSLSSFSLNSAILPSAAPARKPGIIAALALTPKIPRLILGKNRAKEEKGDGEKKMKKSLSEKMLLQLQKKKTTETRIAKKNRFLVIVNILGSAGPIKFVVNEEDSVSVVIDMALKLYAREGRLPILGSDISNFLLYPANAGSDALQLPESIGTNGGRNFVLCKKQSKPQMTEARSDMVARKGSNGWRAWLNKFSSH